MKKLLLTGVVLLFLTSCQNQRYTQQSKEIETVKKLITNYNAKEYEAVVSYFADTANVYFNSSKSFKASKLPEYHAPTDANFSSRSFKDEGLEYEMVVTDKGKTYVNFWGTWEGILAANDKKIALEIHLTFQFIDGKIVAEYGYWDASPIVIALQEIEANSDHLTAVKKMYSALDKGDIPGLAAGLDSNIVWNEAENFIYADGNPYKGPDAVIAGVFQRIGADWEYFKVVDRNFYTINDSMVLVIGRYDAKHNKTSKKIYAQAVHLWTLKNGKAVKFQQYTDTKQAFDAVN